MPLQKAFHLLTHMKFEVGAGLASLTKVDDKIGKISKGVESLSNQFKALGVQVGLELTGAQFGVLGALRQAVSSSEEFYDIQRRLATLIANNGKAFSEGPINFAKSMEISKDVIKNAAMEANKLGLAQGEFLSKFQAMNLMFFNSGLTGKNFKGTLDFTSKVMQAREMLPGIHPADYSFGIDNMISGGGFNQTSPVFRKLKAETNTFSKMTPGRFRNLSKRKRKETLEKGLDELINPDALKARFDSLGVQMIILRNQLSGVYNIFTKIGDTLRGPLIKILKEVNAYIGTHLTKAFENVGKVLNLLIANKSLEKIYLDLMNLATVAKSLASGKGLAFISFTLKEILGMFGGFTVVMRKLLKVVGGSALLAGTGIGKIITNMTILKLVFKTMGFVLRGLASYAGYFALLTTVSRFFEKAKTRAGVIDAKAIAEGLSGGSDAVFGIAEAFHSLLVPFKLFTDAVGDFIAPLFSTSKWIGWIAKLFSLFTGTEVKDFSDAVSIFKKGMKEIGDYLLHFMARLTAFAIKFAPALLGGMAGAKAGLVTAGPLGALIGGIGGAGAGYFLNSKFGEGGKSVSEIQKILLETYRQQKADAENAPKKNQITNINKVEIRNLFPENIEPDRIAVAIKDILIKSAQAQSGTELNDPVKIPGLVTNVGRG